MNYLFIYFCLKIDILISKTYVVKIITYLSSLIVKDRWLINIYSMVWLCHLDAWQDVIELEDY